jgi:hypothetical protein
MDGDMTPNLQPTRVIDISPTTNNSGRTRKKNRSKLPTIILSVLGILIMLGGVAGGWLFLHREISPIPKSLRNSVNFTVYYPDPKKLPTGYSLNVSSFQIAQKNGVLYYVTYDGDKKIAFSVQEKISDVDLQSFYTNYMPLHQDFATPAGKAQIGASSSSGAEKTLVSLPTNTNTWLLITAPLDINQDKLKQVLSSIRS